MSSKPSYGVFSTALVSTQRLVHQLTALLAPVHDDDGGSSPRCSTEEAKLLSHTTPSLASTSTSTSTSSHLRRALQLLTLALFLSSLIAAHHLYSAYHPPSASPSSGPCGADPNAARFRGCFFDPISVAWLPPACHDFELTRDFLTQKPEFWADGSAVSLAGVMQGGHSTLWVREDYLKRRCMFAWRKGHRALMNGGWVDGYTIEWEGVRECEALFGEGDAEGGAEKDGLREVMVRYPTCEERVW